MTGQLVYNAVLNALRVDKRGNALTVDEFNILSPIVNDRVLAHYAKDFEKDISNTDDLGFLKQLKQTLALTVGIASLPSDYYRIIGEPYYTDGGGVRRNIDVVTSAESSAREGDYLTQSTVSYPTCVIGDQSDDAYKYLQIRVYPTSITSIFIDYLREPDTPFLDYYVTNANGTYTFLDVGDTPTVTSAQTYRDGTTGAQTSISVDWEWSSSDLPLIKAFFLSELGVIIPDTLLIEAGLKDKMEISQ